MSTLSKSVTAALLANAVEQAKAYTAPYAELVKELAIAAEAKKAHGEAGKKETVKLWDTFKKALGIAANAGHTATALRVGLEVGCEEAEIPAGSYRSYVATVCSMYAEVSEGELSLEDAVKLSVADARKRYRVLSDEEQARNALKEAIAGWSADEILTLVEVAKGEADSDAQDNLAEVAAKHIKEAQDKAAAEAAKANDAPFKVVRE